MSNYVFVTRGLLASLDDEAELAAALGHELGHLAEHHAAQRARARQGVLDAAVEAAVVTGSVTVGRSVARDGLLALRRYSREQELEADRIGLSLLVRAGYRGDAMASLIDKLRRQSQLELQLMGEAPDSVDRRSATSTHPAPIERRTALRGHCGGGGAGRDQPRGLSRCDRRHVGRRCAAGGLRARQQVPASPAQARLRGAARLPSVQRPGRRAGRRPRPLAAVLLLHQGADAGQPCRVDAQQAEADADRHPGGRDRRCRGRNRRQAARLRYRPRPGALRDGAAWRSGLLLQSAERGARSRPPDRRPGQRRPHFPHAVRRRGGGAQALSPARGFAGGQPPPRNSPGACPTAITGWNGCSC